jgi:hypothetical protein
MVPHVYTAEKDTLRHLDASPSPSDSAHAALDPGLEQRVQSRLQATSLIFFD